MISGDNHIRSVLSRFRTEGSVRDIVPIESGHIHRSFQVILASGTMPHYVLQQINDRVFQNVPHLMENLERIIRHLKRGESGKQTVRIPDLIPGRDGASYVRDEAGDSWRLFQFVPDSHVLDRVRAPDEARAIGRMFGEFLDRISDLQGEPLHETIPDFHGFQKRLNAYWQVLKKDAHQRVRLVRSEIEWIEKTVPLLEDWEIQFENQDIPQRITHNDTKWDNVLFDSNHQPICVIDLDTVMPGRIAYDFGDAVRTCCNTASEDEPNPRKVDFDLELFRSFTRGFIGPVHQLLTEPEVNTLIFASQRMTFLIGLRFLTDFLDGDRYYHIQSEDHNLRRARVQFQFFRCLQAHSSDIEDMIKSMGDP